MGKRRRRNQDLCWETAWDPGALGSQHGHRVGTGTVENTYVISPVPTFTRGGRPPKSRGGRCTCCNKHS